MPEGIAGEALYSMMPRHHDWIGEWDQLLPVTQVPYNQIAEQLNARYINPLQGLVRDWQELLQAHDEMSAMSLTEVEDWHSEWEELKKRTRQLLKDEQKVKE